MHVSLVTAWAYQVLPRMVQISPKRSSSHFYGVGTREHLLDSTSKKAKNVRCSTQNRAVSFFLDIF